MEANLEVFAEKLDRFRRYDGAERACHANVGMREGGHLWLRGIIIL